MSVTLTFDILVSENNNDPNDTHCSSSPTNCSITSHDSLSEVSPNQSLTQDSARKRRLSTISVDSDNTPSSGIDVTATTTTEQPLIKAENKDTTGKTYLKISRRTLYPSAKSVPTAYIHASQRRSHTQSSDATENPHATVKMVVLPRILKTDIRRQYARMFVNVVNSHDIPLLFSFLHKYGRRDSQMKKTMSSYTMDELMKTVSPSSSPSSSVIAPSSSFAVNEGLNAILAKSLGAATNDLCSSVHLLGIPAITSYWQTLSVIAPDETISIDDITIRTMADSMSCRVCCKYRFSGTLLFDTEKPGYETVLGVLLSTIYDEYNRLSCQALKEMEYEKEMAPPSSMQYYPALSAMNLVHLATSRYGPDVIRGTTPMSMNGMLSIQIDEERRIHGIDFVTASGAST